MAEKVVIGNAELWHGDCRDVLPLVTADACVTDPPYGMDWDVDHTRFTVGKNGHGKASVKDWGLKIAGDAVPFDPAHLLGFDRVVMFGSNHFASRLPVGTTLVWIKKLDTGFGKFLSDAEVAWMKGGHGVYCRRDTTLLGETLNRCHPTQKPVSLMEWCIERIGRPEVVFDPYMGSGTTGVAAMNLGLRFVGVEIHRPYFDEACRRIEDAQRQAPLLPPELPRECVQAGLL